MLNMLCCLGQATEGKSHLVLVCFTAGRLHRICRKAIYLQQHRWSLAQFVGPGVARTAEQVGGLFPKVTRNEEVRGIPAKTISMLFIVGRDWMHCKEVYVTATQTVSPRHGRLSSAGSTSQTSHFSKSKLGGPQEPSLETLLGDH